MKYKVVWAKSTEVLEKIVNELLEEGWELQGGVEAAYICSTEKYLQALVK